MQILAAIRHFLVSDEGPTAVEYSVMLALIIAVCLSATSHLGHMNRRPFRRVTHRLSGS